VFGFLLRWKKMILRSEKAEAPDPAALRQIAIGAMARTTGSAADGGKRRSHPARRAGELSRLSHSGAASVRALLGVWGRWSQFDNLKCSLAESIRRRSA